MHHGVLLCCKRFIAKPRNTWRNSNLEIRSSKDKQWFGVIWKWKLQHMKLKQELSEIESSCNSKKICGGKNTIHHQQHHLKPVLHHYPAGARSAPAGPVGVLRRRLLHRNGNFVPLAPWIRARRRVKTGFRRKTGRSRAVCESIRKIPTGQITEISVASQPLIRFFPLMARNGLFCPFFGP